MVLKALATYIWGPDKILKEKGKAYESGGGERREQSAGGVNEIHGFWLLHMLLLLQTVRYMHYVLQ